MPAPFMNGLQHQKMHATTVIAGFAVQPNRFIAYDGRYARATEGGLKDAQGISETAANDGEPISVVTGYSYLVECAEPIAFGDYLKPSADSTGRAVKGSVTVHCGRALSEASAAGQLVECQIVRHAHP